VSGQLHALAVLPPGQTDHITHVIESVRLGEGTADTMSMTKIYCSFTESNHDSLLVNCMWSRIATTSPVHIFTRFLYVPKSTNIPKVREVLTLHLTNEHKIRTKMRTYVPINTVMLHISTIKSFKSTYVFRRTADHFQGHNFTSLHVSKSRRCTAQCSISGTSRAQYTSYKHND
jgi:hypothetical protein